MTLHFQVVVMFVDRSKRETNELFYFCSMETWACTRRSEVKEQSWSMFAEWMRRVGSCMLRRRWVYIELNLYSHTRARATK